MNRTVTTRPKRYFITPWTNFNDEEYDLGTPGVDAIPVDPSLSWYDSEGQGGGTLKGLVTSPCKQRIPLAKVILGSEGGILRMENIFTRPDGSFEVANLQSGEKRYDVTLLSPNGGVVHGSMGLQVDSQTISGRYFDLVIIGGGPAGYGAALYGASAGLSVILVERDKVGGTCLHRGCIPAKELLETASITRTVKAA